jgi:hypothetical protein
VSWSSDPSQPGWNGIAFSATVTETVKACADAAVPARVRFRGEKIKTLLSSLPGLHIMDDHWHSLSN